MSVVTNLPLNTRLLGVDSSPPRLSGPVAHGETTHSRREVQLSNPLLTLTVAPAAEPDVGFLALTVSTPAVCEWLQPLLTRQ
jgi:hypothetical protein